MERREQEARDGQFVAQLTAIQLPLLLYVRSLLLSEHAAQDVVQQANATLWEKRDQFEPGTNFKAWALSIARFEVLNFRKQQARDARLTFSDDLEQTIATELANSRDDIQQRHEALKKCLDKLRARDRALLIHRYSSAGTLAEYADQVGRSAGGLKVTLHRLRNGLLACIQMQIGGQEASA